MPKKEIMFKMQRACIKIKDKYDLWIFSTIKYLRDELTNLMQEASRTLKAENKAKREEEKAQKLEEEKRMKARRKSQAAKCEAPVDDRVVGRILKRNFEERVKDVSEPILFNFYRSDSFYGEYALEDHDPHESVSPWPHSSRGFDGMSPRSVSGDAFIVTRALI